MAQQLAAFAIRRCGVLRDLAASKLFTVPGLPRSNRFLDCCLGEELMGEQSGSVNDRTPSRSKMLSSGANRCQAPKFGADRTFGAHGRPTSLTSGASAQCIAVHQHSTRCWWTKDRCRGQTSQTTSSTAAATALPGPTSTYSLRHQQIIRRQLLTASDERKSLRVAQMDLPIVWTTPRNHR